jgi:UDP-N-acetylmuramate--alanine ligase
VLLEFRGAGRRFEPRGESHGIRVFDDYGHHPTEIAATLEAARSAANGGRLLVLFQPHLYSRTRHLAPALARALSAADAVAVTRVYAAREEPVEGVEGKLVVDALAAERPGMPVAWMPVLEDAARFLSRRARPGDLVLTIGAGDVQRAAPLILQELD